MSAGENVTELRWSEQRYDDERAKFAALYGESNKEAMAKRDQALAVLFYRSGWTQEKLAAKEGKGQSWVDQRLRFGRFLTITTTVVNVESAPSPLSERCFRGLWNRTQGPSERERFVQVRKLLDAATLAAPRRQNLTKTIKDKFADGEWYAASAMAEEMDETVETVTDTVQNIQDQKLAGLMVERKKVRGQVHFRLVEAGNLIPYAEIKEKFTPLIKELKDQAKGHMVHWSPAIVLDALGRMQKYLDQWAE